MNTQYPLPYHHIGSTPTSRAERQLAGVKEVRAGVYVFFDLFMADLRFRRLKDIALPVLTTVIGHQYHKGWIMADAGRRASPRDRGTVRQGIDHGSGLLCNLNVEIIPGPCTRERPSET